jgi:hypothetical protein
LGIGAIVEGAPERHSQVNERLGRAVVALFAGPEFVGAAVVSALLGIRQNGSRQAFDGGLRLQGQALVMVIGFGQVAGFSEDHLALILCDAATDRQAGGVKLGELGLIIGVRLGALARIPHSSRKFTLLGVVRLLGEDALKQVGAKPFLGDGDVGGRLLCGGDTALKLALRLADLRLLGERRRQRITGDLSAVMNTDRSEKVTSDDFRQDHLGEVVGLIV